MPTLIHQNFNPQLQGELGSKKAPFPLQEENSILLTHYPHTRRKLMANEKLYDILYENAAFKNLSMDHQGELTESIANQLNKLVDEEILLIDMDPRRIEHHHKQRDYERYPIYQVDRDRTTLKVMVAKFKRALDDTFDFIEGDAVRKLDNWEEMLLTMSYLFKDYYPGDGFSNDDFGESVLDKLFGRLLDHLAICEYYRDPAEVTEQVDRVHKGFIEERKS